MNEGLDRLIRDLEGAASALRDGSIDSDGAAALVERCAELAARLGAELDRAAREAEREPVEGQERLL